jgi:hypothetical protein
MRFKRTRWMAPNLVFAMTKLLLHERESELCSTRKGLHSLGVAM